MTYLDNTEHPKPRTPPKLCPLCGGDLVARWVGLYSHHKDSSRALPYFVCLTCKIAARIFKLPELPLHPTRKAARVAAKKDLEATPRGKRRAELYAQPFPQKGYSF